MRIEKTRTGAIVRLEDEDITTLTDAHKNEDALNELEVNIRENLASIYACAECGERFDENDQCQNVDCPENPEFDDTDVDDDDEESFK